MSKKYGFYTSNLEIKPYLSKQEVWQDCEADLIPNLYRRPGTRSYYIINKDEVEPYYRSKGLPEQVIKEKLLLLKIGFPG